MEIHEINTLDDFESIKGEWNKLLYSIKDKNIFLTWEWNYAWYKHFHTNQNLSILVFEDGGGLHGILPLVRRKYYNRIFEYDVLENMGIPRSDYSGVIISDTSSQISDQIFDLLFEYIKKHRLIFRMEELPRNVEINQRLKKRLALNGIFIKEKFMNHCPYISLHGSWEDYYLKLSKKLMKDICRRKRKFEREIGELAFRKCLNDDMLENDFNTFLDLQRKKRNRKCYKQIGKNKEEFLYDVCQSFKANDWLGLSFLEANETAISCDLSFEYNNIFYDYMPAFDPQYSSYSVGTIHLIYILKDLFLRKFNEYDFMRGDEPYKYDWTSSERDNEQIMAYDDRFTFNIKYIFLNYLIKFRKVWV